MRYLVTGGAGFVGSHLVDRLLARGDEVVCVDNFNDYYSPARKRKNIAGALEHPGYTLVEGDFRDTAAMEQVFAAYRPERVAHIGAMAGPRPSVERPLLYEEVNVRGTVNLLELSRRHDVRGFVLASTSSVYGQAPTPWSEDLATDRPLSPYAATKKAAEVLSYTFHYLHKLPTRVVRFFTVYGPRGRPDMTPYLFVDAMVNNRPITLFDGGQGVYRDWTYVDDIVAGVVAALDCDLPFEILNLGNSSPVQLCDFIALLERVTGLTAIIDAKPLPAADPPITYANVDKARRLLGFQPATSLELGLERFWAWYQTEVLGRRST
ncbi:MAG: GDP-mannose 4,6-dehydratase [Kouleothrix sp.]|nr:GDP-mannose 4,6-dehydratase [Kouleothrix sp.]